MLALPFIYGDQGLKVALVMLATSAVGLAVYKILKRTFVRERPFIRHSGISLARRSARSIQLPLGPHAACSCLHLAGLRGVSRTRFALVPLALSIAASRVVLGLHYPTDVLVGRLVRRCKRRDRRVADLSRPSPGFMRVLFVSDVYFPRVNGVSTSIRTFRSDLARLGVETMLVAPAYPGAAQDDDPSIIRVPSGGVPRDPEDRRFLGGPLKLALNAELAARVDLVHIHTPFIAHYAGVRFAREHGLPVVATYHTFFEDYLHHYVPILPRGIGRWIARRFTLSQCADVAALISPSAPMRDALAAYGVTTPIEVLPTGLAAESFAPGDGARFRKQFALPADRPLLLYVGRVAFEKNIDFLLRTFVRVLTRQPDALFVIAGEGPALAHPESTGARAWDPGRGSIHRLSRSKHRTSRLLCGRRCFRIRFTHGNPGAGAARGHGAGHAGRIDCRTRHALDPHAGLRRIRGAGAGGSLRGGGDAGAETRARCAAPGEVASSRRILGVAGDGTSACVVLREGKSNFFRSSNGVPPGPRFEWSAAPGNRSS